MKSCQVRNIPIQQLSVTRKQQMIEVAARYYRHPDLGLAEELRFGNLVYFVDNDVDEIGCFLIVDFDHHSATIDGICYRFTYLGLGCATKAPMIPVFQQVKRDFARCLAPGTVGVLHLTTRTPFAYRSIVRAFGCSVFPTDSHEEKSDLIALARNIKSYIHHRSMVTEADSPFILRGVKKGPFNENEVARIGALREDTPLSRLKIACDGADELIVFHTFPA